MQVQDAKLLSEFFMRLVAEISNDQHDSTFLPKGAAYLRGPQTYVQVLKDNNFSCQMWPLSQSTWNTLVQVAI